MPGPKGPERGIKSPFNLRVGIDIAGFEGVDKQNDPGAISDTQFADGQNARHSGGRVIPRGGLTKVNPTTAMSGAIVGMIRMRETPGQPATAASSSVTTCGTAGPAIYISRNTINVLDISTLSTCVLTFDDSGTSVVGVMLFIPRSRGPLGRSIPHLMAPLYAVENNVGTIKSYIEFRTLTRGPYINNSMPSNLSFRMNQKYAPGSQNGLSIFSSIASLPGAFREIFFVGWCRPSGTPGQATGAGDFHVWKHDVNAKALTGEYSFPTDDGNVFVWRVNEEILAIQAANQAPPNTRMTSRIVKRSTTGTWSALSMDVSALSVTWSTLNDVAQVGPSQAVTAFGKLYIVGDGFVYNSGSGANVGAQKGFIMSYNNTTFKGERLTSIVQAGDQGYVNSCGVNLDGKLVYAHSSLISPPGTTRKAYIGLYDGTTWNDTFIDLSPLGATHISGLLFLAGYWWAFCCGGVGNPDQNVFVIKSSGPDINTATFSNVLTMAAGTGPSMGTTAAENNAPLPFGF